MSTTPDHSPADATGQTDRSGPWTVTIHSGGGSMGEAAEAMCAIQVPDYATARAYIEAFHNDPKIRHLDYLFATCHQIDAVITTPATDPAQVDLSVILNDEYIADLLRDEDWEGFDEDAPEDEPTVFGHRVADLDVVTGPNGIHYALDPDWTGPRNPALVPWPQQMPGGLGGIGFRGAAAPLFGTGRLDTRRAPGGPGDVPLKDIQPLLDAIAALTDTQVEALAAEAPNGSPNPGRWDRSLQRWDARGILPVLMHAGNSARAAMAARMGRHDVAVEGVVLQAAVAYVAAAEFGRAWAFGEPEDARQERVADYQALVAIWERAVGPLP